MEVEMTPKVDNTMYSGKKYIRGFFFTSIKVVGVCMFRAYIFSYFLLFQFETIFASVDYYLLYKLMILQHLDDILIL